MTIIYYNTSAMAQGICVNIYSLKVAEQRDAKWPENEWNTQNDLKTHKNWSKGMKKEDVAALLEQEAGGRRPSTVMVSAHSACRSVVSVFIKALETRLLLCVWLHHTLEEYHRPGTEKTPQEHVRWLREESSAAPAPSPSALSFDPLLLHSTVSEVSSRAKWT